MGKHYCEKLQHLARSCVECGRGQTRKHLPTKTDRILYLKTSSFLDRMRVANCACTLESRELVMQQQKLEQLSSCPNVRWQASKRLIHIRKQFAILVTAESALTHNAKIFRFLLIFCLDEAGSPSASIYNYQNSASRCLVQSCVKNL